MQCVNSLTQLESTETLGNQRKENSQKMFKIAGKIKTVSLSSWKELSIKRCKCFFYWFPGGTKPVLEIYKMSTLFIDLFNSYRHSTNFIIYLNRVWLQNLQFKQFITYF